MNKLPRFSKGSTIPIYKPRQHAGNVYTEEYIIMDLFLEAMEPCNMSHYNVPL
jgi:hypothetical protein